MRAAKKKKKAKQTGLSPMFIKIKLFLKAFRQGLCKMKEEWWSFWSTFKGENDQLGTGLFCNLNTANSASESNIDFIRNEHQGKREKVYTGKSQ